MGLYNFLINFGFLNASFLCGCMVRPSSPQVEMPKYRTILANRGVSIHWRFSCLLRIFPILVKPICSTPALDHRTFLCRIYEYQDFSYNFRSIVPRPNISFLYYNFGYTASPFPCKNQEQRLVIQH